MNHEQRLAVFAPVVLVMIMVGCGTGSTGFDIPPNPGPSPENRSESEVIDQVLDNGICRSVPSDDASSGLVLCSNDPPAGIVSESLLVEGRPLRCPTDGCPLDLQLALGDLPESTELLAAWRATEESAIWRTGNSLFERDTSLGLIRGTLLVPEPDVPTEIQVALLVYPAGFAIPDLPPEGLEAETLAELGAPQVAVLVEVIEPLGMANLDQR